MKKQMNYWIMGALALTMICLNACGDDDDEPDPQVLEKVYVLDPVSEPGINGTITFTKQDENSTLVSIELVGTASGDSHPAHIHANAASAGGPIVIGLNSVDGTTGRSETVVTQLDNGTAITYEGLLTFDGHANVHLSSDQLSILIAQGDIGSNLNGEGDNEGDDGY